MENVWEKTGNKNCSVRRFRIHLLSATIEDGSESKT